MKDIMTQMEDFGMFRYNIAKILLIVSPEDPQAFKKAFNDKKSDIRTAYERGRAKGDYAVDEKLLKQIKKGDMQAYDRLVTRIMMNEE